MERLGQRTGGGLLIQAAGGGQLGARVEDAGGNESADEIALGATSTREQIGQAEMAQGAEDSGDMAMRKRAEDLEGLIAGDQIFAFQDAAQEVDLSGGPGGEIGEGALLDLGADADGFAEEDGRRGVAVGDGLDVHGSMIQLVSTQYKTNISYLHGYMSAPKIRIANSSRPYEENGVKKSGNFRLVRRTFGQIDDIGVDEIQYAKGHKYLTLVYQIDLDVTPLLWVGRERTIQSFQGFFTVIGEEIASKIVFVCSDMWEPYLKVIRERWSEALHILDRFHIVAKMNKALDEVRAGESRRMASEGLTPVLKKSRWLAAEA